MFFFHFGNELADIAAKEGLRCPVGLFPFIPKSFFKSTISSGTSDILKQRWDSSPHSPWLSSLFPNWASLQTFLSKSEGLLHTRKIASGHYPVQDYLKHRSFSSTSICPHCDLGQTESLDHRVIECPSFQQHRSKMLLSLGFNPSTLSVILRSNDTDQLKALNIFLTACRKDLT